MNRDKNHVCISYYKAQYHRSPLQFFCILVLRFKFTCSLCPPLSAGLGSLRHMLGEVLTVCLSKVYYEVHFVKLILISTSRGSGGVIDHGLDLK